MYYHGIDKKIFTAATIYADEKVTFEGNYTPEDYDGYLGETTVRRAIESSQNIPFVEMLQDITPKKSIKYLKKMGITTLTDKDEGLPLALGGLEQGISPLEMASAYAMIANDGVYIEPTFYTNITNKSGKTIIKNKPKTKKVVSKQTAYILQEILKEPVEGNHGTARYCKVSGIDTAAKTGTTNENYDRWLCGFTPYYTAVTWFGYDQNEPIYFNRQNPAGIIWANVMKKIHYGLDDATFQKPSWIQTATICADSGEIANSGCPNTYEEYFLWGTKPGECTKHSGNKVTNSRSNNSSTTINSNVNTNTTTNELTLDPDLEDEEQSEKTETNTNIDNSTLNITDTEHTDDTSSNNTNKPNIDDTINDTSTDENTITNTPAEASGSNSSVDSNTNIDNSEDSSTDLSDDIISE